MNSDEEYKENKISEIISELEQCRDDERSWQDQVTQVCATGGSFLAIVFGVSFLDNWEEIPVISKSILFHISNITFFVLIGYMTSLGMMSGVRFHYMRNLEDQLCTLIHEHNRENGLIHWMSLSSSITTRNIKHLNSLPSWVHYFCYALATVCAILFCIITTIFQYVNIEKHSAIDNMGIVSLVIFSALVGIAFFYGSINAKKIYHLALQIAHERRNSRLQNLDNVSFDEISNRHSENHPNNSNHSSRNRNRYGHFIKAILYFVYPKTQDIQKPLLIVLGFYTAIILNRTDLKTVQWSNLAIVLFMIDFLVYQARFQWNDIRGLYEDKEAGKTNRLPFWFFGEKKAVLISLLIIALRLLTFAWIAFQIDETIRLPILVCASLILFISIFYEMARSKKLIIPVFILVSFGYPLRFFTGFWILYSDFFHRKSLFFTVFLLLLSYALFGEFSVLFTWTHEANSQKKAGMQFTKRHYEFLYNIVKNRGELPLSNNGKLFDPWNLTFLGSMAVLSSICVTVYKFPVGVEVLFAVSLIGLCFASKKQSYMITPFVLGLAIYRIAWGSLISQQDTFYVYISVTQLVFVVLYYFLRFIFDPDFDFSSFCKELQKKIFILIISEKTWDLLSRVDNP